MNADGIIEVCESLGLKSRRPYQSGARGEHISISCPLAQWTHTDPNDVNTGCSITVNPDGPSLAKCHSSACNFGGYWYTLVQKAVNRRIPVPPELLEVVKKVAEAERIDLEGVFSRACYVVEIVSDRESRLAAVSSPTITGPVMRIPTEVSRHHLDVLEEVVLDQFEKGVPKYVLDRGIKVETAKRWELRYDKRLWRVVFPVRRMDGKLIGMTGRILPSHDVPDRNGEKPTKYHNYSGLNKTRYLYGAHLFKVSKIIVIVEGPFDVLKTSQALGPDVCVCAPLGQGFSPEHKKTIASAHPERVMIFTDDDLAGRTAAEKIVAQLDDVAPTFLMRPKKGKDPGSMTDEEIAQAYAAATPVLGMIVWQGDFFAPN